MSRMRTPCSASRAVRPAVCPGASWPEKWMRTASLRAGKVIESSVAGFAELAELAWWLAPPRLLLLSLDELHVEGDVDVLADEEAAGFEGRVPREAEVLAIDLRGGGEADAGVSPGVLARRAGSLNRKCDGPGYAADGQFASDGVLAFALL